MNNSNFENLSLNERAELVFKYAKFLTTASYYNHRINLYSLKGSFVEVWYDVFNNEVEKIIPMSKPNLFKEYVKRN